MDNLDEEIQDMLVQIESIARRLPTHREDFSSDIDNVLLSLVVNSYDKFKKKENYHRACVTFCCVLAEVFNVPNHMFLKCFTDKMNMETL